MLAKYNKGFAIEGVPCFTDTFVLGGNSALRMFSAKFAGHRNPHLNISIVNKFKAVDSHFSPKDNVDRH